ncbi:hypothetical protein B0J11DRAFT_502098 [Dendryphion nanum]|uniref:Uncharacterized protein n=1 Tax=Dendryphion nanum TaxID=256645 RepID=A0A9P9IY51_9PLEO|nr:hypothetical protein B0J11DRAFT_502098 [Dendryphion nanum]
MWFGPAVRRSLIRALRAMLAAAFSAPVWKSRPSPWSSLREHSDLQGDSTQESGESRKRQAKNREQNQASMQADENAKPDRQRQIERRASGRGGPVPTMLGGPEAEGKIMHAGLCRWANQGEDPEMSQAAFRRLFQACAEVVLAASARNGSGLQGRRQIRVVAAKTTKMEAPDEIREVEEGQKRVLGKSSQREPREGT